MSAIRPKILILSHISELLGGAERSMLEIFDKWAEQYDIKPQFILREPIKSLAGELKNRGWKYYPLRYTFWSDGNPPTHPEDIYRNWQQNTKAVTDIEKIIKRTKPDVIMTNSVVCPWAALAAYNQKVPHIWFVREYGDLDHGRVYEIGRKKTLEDVGNLSALVLANSETLAEHLSNYMNPKKVSAIYAPFDIGELQASASEKVPNPFKIEESLKLVLAGNLARSKGQLEAVRAVGQLVKQGSNIELCLIGKSGDTEFSQQLDNAIKLFAIEDRVHLLGYQTNLLPYVSMADVGIMPSRMEAFGRVTFEYLAIGKPVVGANSGATPEMVKNGVNGYLFKAEDINSLADAIKHYADKPELIVKHGIASKLQAETMMRGEYNTDVAYSRILKALDHYAPTTKPINYLNHWASYSRSSKPPASVDDSLKTKLRRKLRRHGKTVYFKARSLKAKVTGK